MSASKSQLVRRVERRGFSFVEILFAIAVLGIGFIMLAAIFPVGLQQTKLTLDETTAAGNARGAAAVMTQLSQAVMQYKDIGVNPPDATNSTSILPATFAGPWPLVGNGAGEVPAGQSRTFPGQVRSLRDGRNFCDAWNPAINDPPRPIALATHEMAAVDITSRRDAIWNRINSELLSKSNDRNAYAVLYKRDVTFSAAATASAGTLADLPKPAESAQLIVVNAQVAARSAYQAADSSSTTALPFSNLELRPVGVTIQFNATTGTYVARFSSVKGTVPIPPPTDHVNFSNSAAYDAAALGSSTSNGLPAITEGSFIVISDDNIATLSSKGRMNGRIYRLGNYRTDITPAAYELAPGYDFVVDPGVDGVLYNGSAAGNPGSTKDDITAIGNTGNLPGNGQLLLSNGPAVAYVLGRGFDNANMTPPGTAPNPSNYVGLAQDVAIYTTFVPAN